MKIERIFTGLNDSINTHPYKYRISLPKNDHYIFEAIRNWVIETEFKCTMVPGAVYVVEEKDAIWFVMRWS